MNFLMCDIMIVMQKNVIIEGFRLRYIGMKGHNICNLLSSAQKKR